MKNKLKYESYQVAMRLLENAKRHKDMPMCIAAVAVAESIIADRCQSYLFYKEKESQKDGKKMEDMSLTEMDVYWDRAKAEEKNKE